MSVISGIDTPPIRIRKKTIILFIIAMAGSGVLATLLAREVFKAQNAARASTVL